MSTKVTRPTSLRLRDVEAFVLRSALQRPVVTSFGIMKDRPAVLVRIRDSEGFEGWGEAWCNFPAPAAEYRAALVQQVLRPLCVSPTTAHEGPGALFRDLTARTGVLAIQCGDAGAFAQSIAAIEMACWDLLARRAGQPLWAYLGGNGSVPVYASGIHPAEADERIGAAIRQGHTRFKLKVGFDLEADALRLEGLCRGYQAVAWMVDANQAWDEQGSLAAVERFGSLPLQWIEEPMRADADSASWQKLARKPVRLAGGENLRGQAHFETAAQWLSVLQPDLGKWGGVSGSLAIAAMAQERGRWFCPHWLGSGVGLSFTLAVLDAHLAKASSSTGWAEVDVNPNPLRDEFAWCREIRAGTALLGPQPGIGDHSELERLVQMQIGAG